MPWLMTLMRRMLWLALLGAIGGAVFTWWRERNEAPTAAPPQWPPLDPSTAAQDGGATDDARCAASAPADSGSSSPVSDAADTAGSAPDSPSDAATSAPAASEAAGASGDGADGAPSGDDASWVEPNEDGSCPISHPVKANDNSGIFHVPGGRFYDRTGAERCYATEDGAAADGYRRSKS